MFVLYLNKKLTFCSLLLSLTVVVAAVPIIQLIMASCQITRTNSDEGSTVLFTDSPLALKFKLKTGFVKQVSLMRFWDGAGSFRSTGCKELAPGMNTKHLGDIFDG